MELSVVLAGAIGGVLAGLIIMKIKEHIPHFVKEHKKAIAVAVVIFNYCNNFIIKWIE